MDLYFFSEIILKLLVIALIPLFRKDNSFCRGSFFHYVFLGFPLITILFYLLFVAIPRRKCSDGNGGCEHKCTDTKDGLICSCKAGYMLGVNGTCHGLQLSPSFQGISVCSSTILYQETA